MPAAEGWNYGQIAETDASLNSSCIAINVPINLIVTATTRKCLNCDAIATDIASQTPGRVRVNAHLHKFGRGTVI